MVTLFFLITLILHVQVEVMQQLLQSQSTSYRLIGLKRILAEAVEELSALMIEDGVMPDDLLNKVKAASYSKDDDDEDLMPPPEYTGVTIESELDDELVAELNISDEDFADYKNNNGRSIFNKTVMVAKEQENKNGINSTSQNEIDPWAEGADAFQ